MKKLLAVSLVVLTLTCFMAVPAFSAPKLIVKNAGASNDVLHVEDTGFIGVNNMAPADLLDVTGDGISSNLRLTKYGGNPGAVFRAAGGSLASPTQVITNGLLGGFVGAGYTNGGAFSANKIGIYFRASENFTAAAQGTYFTFETTHAGTTTKAVKMTLNDTGLNVVGTVSQTSSREFKDNITDLSAEKAMDAIKTITPVTYNYKNDEVTHVGFIAEDVPALVASKDRKTLSAMDIVAVLTKVVQEQQRTIADLTEKINLLQGKVSKITNKDVVGRLAAE